MSSIIPPWQTPAEAPPTTTVGSPTTVGPFAPPMPVDPDAPLWTWRQRERGPTGSAVPRSVTTTSDLVLPTSLDTTPVDHARVGASYGRAFATIGLPRKLTPLAWGRLARLAGVHLTVINHPVPTQSALGRLQDAARRMRIAADDAGPEQAQQESLAASDLRRHLDGLVAEQTAHHLIGLYLLVTAPDRATLQERSTALTDTARTIGLSIVASDLHHWETWLTTTPLGYEPRPMYLETDTPTLARLLPTSPPRVDQVHGIPLVYGVRDDGASSGAPIIVDPRALLSPHRVKLAATRSGKSYQAFLEILQLFAHGHVNLLMIDPKDQEYRALVERLGGTYVVLSPQSTVRINPLMLPHGDAAVIQHLRRLQQDLRTSRAALLTQLITDESRLRGRSLTPQAEAVLDEAILACYQDRGMTADPATWHADAPTLGDVAAHPLVVQADPTLAEALTLFTTGTLGRLLNTPGNLPVTVPRSSLREDVGVLAFDLSALISGTSATFQRVMPVLISNYCLTTALATAGRCPTELFIDEAWTLLQTAAGSSLLESAARVGGELKLALTVMTQQVREFLYRPSGDGEVANASGQAFLANCETVLLLRQLNPDRSGESGSGATNPVRDAAQTFGLRPREIDYLNRCGRTERGSTGLLKRGQELIPLRIPPAPAPLHTWLTERYRATEGGTDHA